MSDPQETAARQALKSVFRDVMADVATPVTVVTTTCADGPRGTTVSAFASLSMDPLMVMVALDRSSRLLSAVRESGRFGVNVLGRDQVGAALAFARKGGAEKFDGVGWTYDEDLPMLTHVPGWIACEVADYVEGGDHVVLFGRVISARTTGGAPLTYHSRSFGTHRPIPVGVSDADDEWEGDSGFMRAAYGVG